MEFIIVTGVSGAGKSQAVKALEDIGYYCMDNLPPALLINFAELCYSSNMDIDKVALVADTRGGAFFKDFFKGLKALEEKGFKYKVLFLDASDKELIKRYKEHRRPHPMSMEARIVDGIAKERELLEDVRNQADYIIDTTDINIHELKAEIYNIFLNEQDDKNIAISLVSFGFKYGVLLDGDLIFDVRFLPNPYYIEDLRPLTGKDRQIKEYVLGFEDTHQFLNKLMDILKFLIPLYEKEGKSQLVIGIGCTGGKHRSVAITEALKDRLNEIGYNPLVNHREEKRYWES